MKFSILVPVYNVEKYIEQCVESLLNQSYKGEYEIILVDDGSTDSSGSICGGYAKKYPDKIRVIHKKNEGLVSARQAGIDNAKGEFCLFVDSDDFVESNLLEAVFNALKKHAETDAVIFTMNYSDGLNKIPKGSRLKPNETVFENESKKEIYEALISTSFVTSLCLKAIKTDILKADPTDYSLYYDKNMAEDWFRSIPALTSAEKIVYINEPLYNYRTNEASISRSYRHETIPKKIILYVYERLSEYLPLWGMDTAEYRQKLNARWLNEAMYTFSTYYENVPSKDKKAVLEYDWNSMLPEDVKKSSFNPFENKANRKLYNLITKKKITRIKLYFLRKNLYKYYRNLKSRLLNK